MTHENHQPDDPMIHRMSGAESGEQDPRALLAEAQMTWMSTGLEPWFQKEIDIDLQEIGDFYDSKDENLSEWIENLNFSKNAESPTLVFAGCHDEDEMSDSFQFQITRLAMEGDKPSYPLTMTVCKITKYPNQAAELTSLWNNSETLPVSPKLAAKLKRLAEIGNVFGPNMDCFDPEGIKSTEQALEFLSSIE